MLTLVAGTADPLKQPFIIARVCLPRNCRSGNTASDSLSPVVVTCREVIWSLHGAETSSAIIVPSRSSKRASAISGMGLPIRKGMLPGKNAHGSPVACCRSSPVFKPCRALPVAHPGCPVDHLQTLVNKSPGDLWMRCIGSISFVFCYIALGDESDRKNQLQKIAGLLRSDIHNDNPFPENQRGSALKNSPS